MALFGWKKSGSGDAKGTPKTDAADNDAGAANSNGSAAFEPQPEKARVWFDYAKSAADSFNYEYALACYANGIKLDPDAMSAHEAMFEVGIKYMNKQGKPATSKEIKGIEDSSVISKFAAAEFAWMKDVANASLASKALEGAIKAGKREYGKWIATRVLNVALRQKKISKSHMVQLKDLFKQVEAWNEAIGALQKAKELDPGDADLDHEYKDLSAQRAMDQGGYEKAAGKEGGFRAFVKDADKQRELIESEAIVGNESAEQRNLQRAKDQYEKTPTVPDVISQYAQLLKKNGSPENEKIAYDVYLRGFKDTSEYRFRMAAGDIKLEQSRRELESLQSRLEANPTDSALKAKLDAARKSHLELESAEIGERVTKYPTDRPLKMRLGEVEFALGNYEEAMGAFQTAKDEPKLRVRAGHLLGKCFAAEGWHTEAVSEFKEALAAIDATEKERELDIRYDLMDSLIEYAKLERSVDQAREALEICSGIARKDITYRNIRAKRKEVDQLIRELSGGADSAG